MKVRCPTCHKVCHKINDTFDPDVRPNGGMVDLLNPWLSYGWGKFGEDSYGGAGVMASDMLCPICQAPLAPKGRLSLVPDDHQEVPKPKPLSQLNQERIAELYKNLPMEGVEVEITAQARVPSDEPIPSLTQDNKPWMCVVCGWTGKTEAALKRHITMTGHN